MNKKEIAQQFTRDCQSFSEGRKQMLDPNQPSISFEQVTNMLKEIEQTHGKIMSNTEAYRTQYRILESLYSGLHSKIATLTKADREFGRAVDNVINRVIKIPKVLPLATLLDRYSGGNNIVAYNEHNLATTPLAKKRKKKKRRLG